MTVLYLNPIKNVYVSSAAPSTNFSALPSLFIGRGTGPSDLYRTFIQFDLSKIPTISTITDASLHLAVYLKAVSGDQTVNISRLLGDFDESSITWNTAPIGASAGVSTTITDSDINRYISFNITNLVKGWFNGSMPNNGLSVLGVENTDALIGFRSTRFSNSALWPYLQVSFASGIATTYSTETSTISSGATFNSTPVYNGPRPETSFLINNIGSNEILAEAQVSVNQSIWTKCSPKIRIDSGSGFVLNTSAPGTYARISVFSESGSEVSITPTTKDE